MKSELEGSIKSRLFFPLDIFEFQQQNLTIKKKKIPLSSQSGSLEPHRKMTAVVKERGWECARTEAVRVVRRI